MKKLIALCALTAWISVGAYATGRAKPVVSILGDSYSTFQNYIPQGNAFWYVAMAVEGRTDVCDVRQTWWWQLIDEGGYILGVNDSFSGATVCNTGYNGDDYADRSFVTRLNRIVPSDILLIFGATNDSWAGSPIGEYVYDNINAQQLYNFRPAVAKLLQESRNRYPGMRTVFIINSELKDEIVSSIQEICRHEGVECLLLHDIDKIAGHPSVKGMRAIKNQVLEFLQRSVSEQ